MGLVCAPKRDSNKKKAIRQAQITSPNRIGNASFFIITELLFYSKVREKLFII